jgi:hypothetical protein
MTAAYILLGATALSLLLMVIVANYQDRPRR